MAKGLKGFQKGHPSFLTEESKKKISVALKGKMPKNLYVAQKLAWQARRGQPMTGKRKLGWKLSEETKNKISKNNARTWLGKHFSEEVKQKIKNKLLGKYSGEKSWRWIKDRTSLKNYYKTRQNPEYKQWRKKVFLKDDYRCMDCGARGSANGKKIILNADHIFPWAKYPRLRYELQNGQTLCQACHLTKTIFERKGKVEYAL